MGCFLHCFGLSKRRQKRPRKPYNRLLVKDIIRGSYEHLDSSVPLIDDSNTEDFFATNSEFKDKPKNQLSSKIRKKVTFDLNIQVFEPVAADYHLLESYNEEEQKKSDEQAENEVVCPLPSTGHNWRYQNCSDCYDDDDDEIEAYEDCDLDDEIGEEYTDDDGDNYVDAVNGSLDDISEQFNDMSLESANGVLDGELGYSSSVTDNQCASSNANARDRSRYVNSVLNPIENLTQWKAVKAGAAAVGALPRVKNKENITVEKEHEPEFNPRSNSALSQLKPPQQEVAINASLSNWL